MELSEAPLPVAETIEWAGKPTGCGAVVSFLGNARDNSEGRQNVSVLEYEAYESQVLPRLEALAESIFERWGDVERIVLLHRIGKLVVGDTAVIVVTASPHREAAFESAKYGIDTLKATIPIWKKEFWDGGQSWATNPQHIREV